VDSIAAEVNFFSFTLINFHKETCPNNCNNRGLCVYGHCICQGEFDGKDCSKRKCQNDCNKHGECDQMTMKCNCHPGFKGEYCEEKKCMKPCHNGGKCIDGVCFCEIGWSGKYCQSSKIKIPFKKNDILN